MRISRSLAALALVLALLAAAAPRLAAEAGKGWTLLVYMMADNDLEESAVTDLEEMAASGAGSGFDLLVLADRGCRYSAEGAGGLPAWSGASLLAAEGGRLRRLEDWGQVDMGDPATLARFIAAGAAARPAARYALLFWDHGSAWSGFGVDESSGSGLDLDELGRGAREGLAKAGLARLDLVGFDACLMASFEAMSAFQGLASYFLASEELEPGHGWDYRSLAFLGKKPASSPVDLGGALIEGYMRQAEAERNGERATLGLVDLGRLPALDAALGDFAKAARGAMGEAAGGLGRVAGTALAYGKAGSPERDSHMVDLGSLAEAAGRDPALAGPAAALRAALARAVVSVRSGALLKGSSGISIYFPNRLKLFDEAYSKAGRPQWKGLLVAYYDAGAAAAAKVGKPRFGDADGRGRLSRDGELFVLKGRLEPGCAAGVVGATLYYGIEDEEATIFLGDEEAAVDASTGAVEGSWDGTILVLRQGRREAYGYLSVSGQEEGRYLFSIPFAYFADGKLREDYEYAYMDLVVDEDYQPLSSSLYKENDEGMTAELKPAKGSKLVPLVEVFDEESEESTMEMTVDWGFDARAWESIELDFEEVSGEKVFLELEAYDAADESDSVYAELEL